MDFAFTPEQDELAALARRILEDATTHERMREIEATDERFDRDLYASLARTGVLGVALPAEDGGGGWGLIEQCRVLAEAGRTVAPVPVLASIVLGAMPVARFGTSGQRARWVAPAASGELVLSAALTEELNPDPTAPAAVRAERDGDGHRLDGTKTTVPAGPLAGAFLVPAATDDGPAVFVVEASDPGVRAVPQHVTNAQTEALLELDGVRAGPDRRLAGDGVVPWMVRHAVVGVCAHQLGVLERALELTADYSKERVQFDRPIATFQAVGQRLADAYTDVEAVRLTLWQAAWRLSEGLPCDTEIATAKFWASDAGHRIAHTTVHVHGGVGIDLDHPAHRYFVAAKRNEFLLGTATDQLLAIGATLAAEPA